MLKLKNGYGLILCDVFYYKLHSNVYKSPSKKILDSGNTDLLFDHTTICVWVKTPTSRVRKAGVYPDVHSE